MARTKKQEGEERIEARGRLWKKESLEAYKEYQNEFIKDTYQSFVFRCNKQNEADIIQHLKKQPNIAGYIKKLISDDMAGNKPPIAHSAFVADELIKLSELKEKGILDAKEFSTLKKRLVDYKEGK